MNDLKGAVELLLCPFCGRQPREPIKYNGTLETGCPEFECAGSDVLAPLECWNTRAALTITAAQLETAARARHEDLQALYNNSPSWESMTDRYRTEAVKAMRAAFRAMGIEVGG